MSAIKRHTKYAKLTLDQKQEKYNESSLKWYHDKSDKEKQAMMKRIKMNRKGKCDICNNGKIYNDLVQHNTTQKHIDNAKKTKH